MHKYSLFVPFYFFLDLNAAPHCYSTPFFIYGNISDETRVLHRFTSSYLKHINDQRFHSKIYGFIINLLIDKIQFQEFETYYSDAKIYTQPDVRR